MPRSYNKRQSEADKFRWSTIFAMIYTYIPFKDSFALFPILAIVFNVALAAALSRIKSKSHSELVTQAAAMAALITTAAVPIVTLTFSLTVVSVQIASQTYTPRLLEDFLKDPMSKAVISINMGAYAYCFTLTYFLDESEKEKVVPYVAIHFLSLQMLLVLLSFISFIHFFVNGFRVERILQKALNSSLRSARALTATYMKRSFEDNEDDDDDIEVPKVPYESTFKVMADKSGYVTSFNMQVLVQRARELDMCVRYCHQIGDYVNRGTTICHVWDASTRSGKFQKKLSERVIEILPKPRNAEHEVKEGLSLDVRAERRLGSFCNLGVEISPQRNGEYDITLGIQQLVDIAVRALSPGVNDPQTACQCLDVLTNLLGTIAVMEFNTPSAVDSDDFVRAYAPRRSYAYLISMLEPIRRYGGSDLTTIRRALRLFGDLGVILSRNGRPKRISACLAQMEQWMRIARENFDEKSVEYLSLDKLYNHEVRLIAESENLELGGAPGTQDLQTFITTYKDDESSDTKSQQDDIEASMIVGELKDAINGNTDVKAIHNKHENNTFISSVMDKLKGNK